MGLEVVVQNWEESERGWGSRPDGFTVHLTEEDHKAFLAKHYADERKRNPSGVVPDEYSRPDGEPKKVLAGAKTVEALKIDKKKKGFGIWGAPNGRAPKELP